MVVFRRDNAVHNNERGQRRQPDDPRGYLVLRFWNNDVLANTDAVAQAILDAVEQRI